MMRFIAPLLFAVALLISPAAWAQQTDPTGITVDEDTAPFEVFGKGAIAVQIGGTFSATLEFEVTVDGSTWVSVDALPSSGATAVTSTTSTGIWTVITSGYKSFRVRASAFASGTATITVITAAAPARGSGSAFSGAITSPVGDNTKSASLSVTWATDIDPMNIGPAASGGLGHPCIVYSEAADTAETNCLAQAGQVYHIACTNGIGSDQMWLQLFDDASEPVAGTDTAVVNLGIPGHDDIAGFAFANLYGETFANGIGAAITGAIGSTDNTAAVAGAVCNIWYVSS